MELKKYTVYIDNNFHFMDISYRIKYAQYDTIEEAIEACKSITKSSLLEFFESGISTEELVLKYQTFGDDPWVSGLDNNPFSAWEYAKEEAKILTTKQ